MCAMPRPYPKENFSRPRERSLPAEENDTTLEGRNAVNEALRSSRQIEKVFVVDGAADRSLARLVSQAKEQGAVVVKTDRRKLDQMSTTGAHQGIIAYAAAHEYAQMEDIFARAEEKGEAPLIVLCDELSDPHNLGAILRTAECAGAHGVIVPKRRSVGLTATVAKASAGAIEYMPVVRVSNLSAAIRELKDRGVWVFGTTAEGTTDLYEADFARPCAIVIGSEGEGMSRIVEENCDYTVSIPMKGNISSLNASAAAAILLYEAARKRK